MSALSPTIPEVARAIATALADDRVRRHNEDQLPPSVDEERHMARLTAAGVLAKARPLDAWGFDAIPNPDDRQIIDEAIAQVLGLGRLEPLLEDDEISDIHIRGNFPVWVKTRNGERREHPPIVQTDAELVDLIRRIASRMGHREQRFDPAHPELNLQLPDGSRLFAAMEISSHPTLVIRRHRFEFSAISQLVERQMMESEVGSFLAAAGRSRKNIIVAGGTGSGKPSTQGPRATGERYLPKAARQSMSAAEYKRTSEKKRADLKKGKQFSKQPKSIAKKAARFR
jgi:hypothetical protein